MSEPETGPPTDAPAPDVVLGEPGEHPLSVLLFSWMRSKLFFRVLMVILAGIGAALIGVEALAPRALGEGAIPGLHGLFGFGALSLAVLSGWPLGRLLRRPEDFYDRRSGEAGRDR